MEKKVLTVREVAEVFGVRDGTLKRLVAEKRIPYSKDGGALRFDVRALEAWLADEPDLTPRRGFIAELSGRFKARYPAALLALRSLDDDLNSRRKPQEYSLLKVANKRWGFVYYVRYSIDGRTLPSKWSCRTADETEARAFAVSERARLIGQYLQKRDAPATMYATLLGYYAEDSALLAEAVDRGRRISARLRKRYAMLIANTFIPFLKTKKITAWQDVTPPILADFQTLLLQRGNTSVTVNWYISGLRLMFAHLVMKGVVATNPFDAVKSVNKRDSNVRGCYDIEQVAGAFNTPWRDPTAELLNLLAYTTGMRNCEINRMRLCDVVEKGDAYFINIETSKTRNGVRLVPLHTRVYAALARFAADKPPDERIFHTCYPAVYRNACSALGARLGLSQEALAAAGISFYSGRHYWKTLMNSGGLGRDIEEVFMGHKVSGDVAKRYCHYDKQGVTRLAAAAQTVFHILDANLFVAN
jgi:excisionase family DNA binding protein